MGIDRRELPTRRNHITQKVRIAGRRILYISVHDDERPAEVFLRVKGPDCSSELIGLYDVIARASRPLSRAFLLKTRSAKTSGLLRRELIIRQAEVP